MGQIWTRLARILLAAALLCAASPLAAQLPRAADDDGTVFPSGSTPPDLTLEELQAEWAAIEAETGIEDTVKDLLRPKYKQAIEVLEQAVTYGAQVAEYREVIQTGPEEAEALRDQLQALPPIEIAAQVTSSGSSEELQKEIDSRRAALNQLNENLSQLTSALVGIKGRPAETSTRLPEAQRELSETLKKLASPEVAPDATSPGSALEPLNERKELVIQEHEEPNDVTT